MERNLTCSWQIEECPWKLAPAASVLHLQLCLPPVPSPNILLEVKSLSKIDWTNSKRSKSLETEPLLLGFLSTTSLWKMKHVSIQAWTSWFDIVVPWLSVPPLETRHQVEHFLQELLWQMLPQLLLHICMTKRSAIPTQTWNAMQVLVFQEKCLVKERTYTSDLYLSGSYNWRFFFQLATNFKWAS